MDAWIQSVAGYLPQLRLDRTLLARELGWSGLALPRKGMRAVAGWDEDPLTMAVEAARPLVGDKAPRALRFASTSAYFTERAQSAIMLDALALPPATRTSDSANSRRAATSALLDSLLAGSDDIIAAADKRPAKPGNAAQLAFGDGAAAVRTGATGSAVLVGYESLTHDLVDRYSSREHPTSYAYEERFVRDIAVELLLSGINAALAKAGVTASAISQAAVAEPVAGCWAACARKLKSTAPNHCSTLADQVGDLGAAQPLFGLGLALAAAKPGEHVLLVGFGSGVDALVLRVESETPGAAAMAQSLREGEALGSITRFFSLTGTLPLDWGMRAEFDLKAQGSVLERIGRDMIGFIGGRDSRGNVQFPKSAFPVNPQIESVERLEDVRLADLPATVVSITADRLNFTPDPPFDFGLVQFDNGARVLMEMVDRPKHGFQVGDQVRMRLRIKSANARLGFRTYFWKAAPVARPQLGEG